MCRIAGVIDFKNSLGKKLEEVTISMRDSMVYGGPDDAGLFMSNNKKVAFGNRRLSIIDLSSNGHQPMSNKTKTIWITYNGEIYNFRELRKELQQEGCTFLSGSDTEVIVNGYEQWGIEKLISKLRGMFAFAIYDERDVINGHKLYLVRDRFGIKPLYYYHSDKYLIFASEVKAIAGCGLISQEENIDAMVKFLQLGSIPVPLTTIKNVYSIPASHYLELKNENITIKRYWNISQVFKSSTNNMKYGDVVELIKSTLDKVMQLHLISDAPLGVFLSGGLDSSALCAIASKYQQNPLVTLSLVFEENSFSEAKYSRLVAKKFNTNHNEITLTEKDFMDEIPSIISAMDQPTVDGVNTYF
ncbi:MAG: asparagine synthase (glutamine-hydrolyzing), partial [Candidatus Melainabacteria bacterium]|nr:asparagine synthase (glutamine-hydrolyzing) [Candidatus Melainabacteria bacterium]